MKGRLQPAGYLIQRLALAAITFIGVTLLVFAITRFAPGDPVASMTWDRCEVLDVERCDALRRETRHSLGLDRPFGRQYVRWLGDLTRLNLGRSIRDGKPVSQKLGERIPHTLVLNGAALALLLGISIPLGVALALHRGRWIDRLCCSGLDLLYAAPYFWTALLLQYVLAVRLGWLPVSGLERLDAGRGLTEVWIDRAWHIVLPACMLAYGSLAYFVRYVRATVIESLDKKFVTTARALGVPPRRLLERHVLRHAAIALIPLSGGLFGRLLAGSVVLETLFSWPGLGSLFSEAVLDRDFAVVQALTALSAVMVLAASLLADLALKLADPRVAFGRVGE